MQLRLPFLEDSTNLAGSLTLWDEPLLHSGIASAEELLGSCGLPLQFWVPGRREPHLPALTFALELARAVAIQQMPMDCFLLPGAALSVHRHWLF